MPRTALILFAHGSRDPEWSAPLRRVCDAVRAQAPALRLELAFLELMPPSLVESADLLLGEGFERIVILPMFIAQGGHLKQDLPLLIDELRRRYPQAEFELSGPLGESDSVVQVMATHVLAQAAG